MSEKKKLNKVFVYGTLKVGGFFGKKLDSVRIKSKPATIRGTLYRIPGLFPSHFPGLKTSGDGLVRGELHEFDPESQVIEVIDRIEQYHKESPKMSMYIRKRAKVETEEGTEKAYVYEFNGPVENLKVVEDGFWKID